jgi:glucose/arabinose dehydrogenase
MAIWRRERRESRRNTRPRWSLRQLESRILLAGDAGSAVGDSSAPLSIASTHHAAPVGAATIAAAPRSAHLVLVAPDAAEIDSIVGGLTSRHEMVLLNENQGLLEQISELLSSRSNVAGVHIITHGASGQLALGGARVDIGSLDRQAEQVRGWAESLSPDADILLYGCATGFGETGERFVRRLAELSQADVAASIDATGSRGQGGDWDLERTVGAIQSDVALSENARRRFEGLLPITIDAAGVTGEEQMLLQLGGVTVATVDNVGGDAYGSVFEQYTIDIDGADIGQLRVVFTNDLFDPVLGDRNLRIDKVTVDGVDYETEDPSVFSTGTWLPQDGVVPGYRQSEFLHADGFFQYASVTPNNGTIINIAASGAEGEETAELRIDGVAVKTWTNVSTTPQLLSYTAASTVTASQIQVAFTNDLWNPSAGIDRNLIVDFIEVDGQVFQTEDPSVYSTGTWLPADGIVPGFRQSETLHTNGYFQYVDQTPNAGSQVVIYASGFEGDENMTLEIDGGAVASWNSVGVQPQGFTYTTADVVTPDQVRVVFTNDLYNPAAGIDRNLIVDRISIDGVSYATDAPNVYSTGSWLPEDGIQPGFRQSKVLNADGYFQYAVEVAVVPNGSGFTTETIVSGLVQPIAFDESSDGRIFVAEKAGIIRVIENGQLLPTPFLDINEEVNSHHDRGMMGIALDPDFANNGYVYVQFAVELDPANPDKPDFNSPAGGRLIRITASAADSNVADPATRVVIQDGHQMSNATHSVGDIDFDNAGNLIYTWGDGGFDPALRLASQDPNSPQGKLFRIDPLTFEGVSENPYYDPTDPTSIASRVWAVGIRNSWKLSVDRATGDVYMGEVTDGGPEEINVMRADGTTILNYGWPYYEDTNRTSYGSVPPNFVYESAFVALPHTESGGGDAIVGGSLWRGDVYPSVYDGRYFFGNFNQGILYTADQNGDFQQFGDAGQFPGTVDIQIGSDGTLWMMSMFTGQIDRLVYENTPSSNSSPIAVTVATTTAGATPVSVTFDASASSDADGDPLLYEWDFQSDGSVDATGAVVSHTYTSVGRSSATLTVSDGNGGTDNRVIEIDVLATQPQDGNLALGRPAVQSPSDGPAIASRAVDGNTDGTFSNDSVAQTLTTRTPLWEVDLGAVYEIGSLQIHTRSDGLNPLNNYWILISETPLSSGNLDAARSDPGVWLYNEVGTAGPLEIITVGTLGRYVRIQMAGVDDVLAIAEVEIFEA